ncbi:putative HTH-type transcriptional regulator YdfH [Pseudoruegeria aquimaris]|uniref:Putative HTH-type transcriptional regulator YdfH n=1 Tax=Pseudoruegeria aquimaris TaxID=393663 RepID=A0A1Y5SS45_9RHOB|nr:GntR family transcriptional regulator [Pseudoruegeria aquimaris]SLN47056.1 putative HTH-type transcriptional regulator YdfH [Pseudoruegeria aquimaris]
MNEPAIAPLPAAANSATEQVYQALYDAVISLELPPGSKVSEAEIARRLDVSRQPVRDAFFRLSKVGFLSIRPQRATLITRISERAVQDAVFTRTALEVECLREAMRNLTAEDAEALKANLAGQEEALEHPEPARFHELDEALHARLCAIAGHPHAWVLIQEQKAHMDRVRYITLSAERRHTVLGEHRALIDAILAGDAARAEACLRSHIGEIRQTLQKARAEHPEFFAEAD